MKAPSRTKIDQLGDRLRRGAVVEADLEVLDSYRLSFVPEYQIVVDVLRNDLELRTTGRPAKSTSSVAEKLQRETIRLSQMQDIAGCRVVVKEVFEQNRVVNALKRKFKNRAIYDRRRKPSYGYRAVHVLVRVDVKTIEVQVRTRLQHMWAEFSEKLADTIDPSIKYGGGPPEIRALLDNSSQLIGKVEDGAESLKRLRSDAGRLVRYHPRAAMGGVSTVAAYATVGRLVAQNRKAERELMDVFRQGMRLTRT